MRTYRRTLTPQEMGLHGNVDSFMQDQARKGNLQGIPNGTRFVAVDDCGNSTVFVVRFGTVERLTDLFPVGCRVRVRKGRTGTVTGFDGEAVIVNIGAVRYTLQQASLQRV